MKVLHLSFHYGCVNDIQNVFEKLGHEVTFQFLKGQVPYAIDFSRANQMWESQKEYYNTFDIVLTSDTVALSYPFLLHLAELKPHLIVLNCNRFTYAMEHDYVFMNKLREVQNDSSYLSKVTFIPYTDFERVWCGVHQVFLHERAIMPVGKYTQHMNDAADIKASFQDLETQYKTESDDNTVFLQRYHNHHRFMDLAHMLHCNRVSCVRGSYLNIDELTKYKAVVVLPDQFSKYFTFESIQAGLVVLLPSTKFLMQLVEQGGYYFSVEGSGGRLTKEYVNLCEWTKYPEARIHFDSFDDMIAKIHSLTPELLEEKKQWCRFYADAIESEHMLQWKNVLAKVERHIKKTHTL